MTIVIRIIRDALGRRTQFDGMYLKALDVDAYNGIGRVVCTPDLRDAMHFESARDALMCWRRQSSVQPLRDDGKPNRPLTAYSVEISDVKTIN